MNANARCQVNVSMAIDAENGSNRVYFTASVADILWCHLQPGSLWRDPRTGLILSRTRSVEYSMTDGMVSLLPRIRLARPEPPVPGPRRATRDRSIDSSATALVPAQS